MGERIRRVRIELGPLPPFALARLDISRLASDPELVPEMMLGGPAPPEMEEENERRRKETRRRELAIIEKYGVADEFLPPLLMKEEQLQGELKAVQEEIAELRSISKK